MPSVFRWANSSSTWRRIFLRAQLVDQDLDPRLVLVVAPAVAVVDAQAGLGIGDQLVERDEVADHGAIIGVRPMPPPT